MRLTVMLGEQLARELERAAPARSRRRSAFVRAALRRALDQLVDASLSGGGRQEPEVRRRRALSAIGRLGKKRPRTSRVVTTTIWPKPTAEVGRLRQQDL